MTPTTVKPKIELEYRPVGRNGTCQVAAIIDGKLAHSDKLDPARASARRRFAWTMAEKVPGLDAADVEAELLRISSEVGNEKPRADAGDILLARPELGCRPEVSWIAIPTMTMGESGPMGRWVVYLRWADGRREKRPLESGIDLADGRRLWLHPQPAPPVLGQTAGWSTEGRADWLAGEPTPDPAHVFRALCECIAFYLDFQSEVAAGTTATLALWVMLSYAYPAWSAIPYLSVGGPLGSGKTHLFRVLGRMVFRPLPSANLTAPVLFRTLNEVGGTLLFDEAERLRDGSPEAGELRSILLAGYAQGTPARRLEPTSDGKFQTRSFDVYGPKAIAGIGGLPEALASRCIRIMMFRAAPDSPKPRRRIDDDPDRWARLRDGLHALALEHALTWLELARRDDVCPTMAGRDYELWQPLLALASWVEEHGADGLLAMTRDHAIQTIEAGRDDAVPDTDELLLRLLADSVVAGANGELTPHAILRRATEREPNLFGRWSTRGVASALKRYGVSSSKSNGQRTYRDVTPAQLVQIQQVYGVDMGLPSALTVLCAPSLSSLTAKGPVSGA
jgi:hypothetical protein